MIHLIKCKRRHNFILTTVLILCNSVNVMEPIIEFEECLRDSPKFRAALEEQEADIDQLEQKLDKVLKMCGLMVDTGKSYVAQHSQFANSLWDLSTYFRDDTDVMVCLNKLIHALQEMNKFHTILLDQASRTILKNLTAFIKGDIKGVKESRHYFEKISVDLDVALSRNSQVPRSRPQEAEETQNLLSATRSCFRHTALDYVHVVSLLQAKKRHEVLSTLLSYMHAYSTFFHQGSDLCQDLDPFFKKLGEEVSRLESFVFGLRVSPSERLPPFIMIMSIPKSCKVQPAVEYVRRETIVLLLSYREDKEHDNVPVVLYSQVGAMRKQCNRLEKEMENRHTYVTSKDMVPPPGPEGGPRMEGYLFKRTSNAFKTWNRRWFSLQDNQLVYRKRTGEENVTVMEEDLRLCSVKPVVDGDRRFCFEVLSPAKSHMLQADSEEMYQSWICAMQQGIGAAIQLSISEEGCMNLAPSGGSSLTTGRESSSSHSASSSISESQDRPSPEKQRKARMWEQLLNIPGNEICCDCENPNPRWASINLGITLCIGKFVGNIVTSSWFISKLTLLCSTMVKKYSAIVCNSFSVPECSGVHRSLGVHYSKVRSLTLDAWEPEILKVMAELGNSIVNKVYEANIPPDFARATPKCHGNIREAWIKAKYVERKFVKLLSVLSDPNHTSPDQRLSRPSQLSVRKWSVRKLRRRPRSKDSRGERRKQRDKLSVVEESKPEPIKENSSSSCDANNIDKVSPPKTEEELNSTVSSCGSPVGCDGGKDGVVDPEVLVFGKSLETQPIEGSIDLSSDQDSTGGEEEEFTGEEDISKFHPSLLLYKAAAAHNLPVMCEALATGADKLWINEEDKSRSPIHQAINSSGPDQLGNMATGLRPQTLLFQQGSVMACEYLLLNGAKINSQDDGGRTPLHLATELGHTAQVCLLLKHRADQHIKDNEGTEPLSIAIKEANPDIVTMLRLAMLNEEMKASELGSLGDDTFNDVVRDFSQLAYSHPERLLRARPEPE
uniref:Arf-GAP with coiled-coil, ANK repeat and PH domain-containing protein 2 n=1 Tax=Timema cristinae TaxID=61476 RepID=A0A7R9CPI2_TIMCR|nr:unnamed protein product [Timema cristinae]